MIFVIFNIASTKLLSHYTHTACDQYVGIRAARIALASNCNKHSLDPELFDITNIDTYNKEIAVN